MALPGGATSTLPNSQPLAYTKCGGGWSTGSCSPTCSETGKGTSGWGAGWSIGATVFVVRPELTLARDYALTRQCAEPGCMCTATLSKDTSKGELVLYRLDTGTAVGTEVGRFAMAPRETVTLLASQSGSFGALAWAGAGSVEAVLVDLAAVAKLP